MYDLEISKWRKIKKEKKMYNWRGVVGISGWRFKEKSDKGKKRVDKRLNIWEEIRVDVAWFASPLTVRSDILEAASFNCWFDKMVLNLDGERSGLVAIIVWGIGNHRNGLLHGENVVNPEVSLRKSLWLFDEFNHVRKVSTLSREHSNGAAPAKWVRPLFGVLKFNCGTSIDVMILWK